MSKLIEIQTGGHNCFFLEGLTQISRSEERKKNHVGGQLCLRHKHAPHRQKKNDVPLLTPPLIGEFGNWMVLLQKKKKTKRRD